MRCDKQVGVGSMPTYINSGLFKRFRNRTLTSVRNCLYSHTSGVFHTSSKTSCQPRGRKRANVSGPLNSVYIFQFVYWYGPCICYSFFICIYTSCIYFCFLLYCLSVWRCNVSTACGVTLLYALIMKLMLLSASMLL
jgi:hypothetical protein